MPAPTDRDSTEPKPEPKEPRPVLTEAIIKRAKPQATQYRLFDRHGLFMHVLPGGTKTWRLKFQKDGKESSAKLGRWPAMSLVEARAAAAERRAQLRKGADPAHLQRVYKRGGAAAGKNTFAAVAAEVLERLEGVDKNGNPRRREETLRRTRRHAALVDAMIGKRPIAKITGAEVYDVLHPYEERGQHVTGDMLRGWMKSVFKQAIRSGRATHNPAAAIGGAEDKPEPKHRAAVTTDAGLQTLLLKIDLYANRSTATALGLKLVMLTAARPGEVRGALWSEISFEEKEWVIPSARMKMDRKHVVPLSRQALQILASLKALAGNSAYVLPTHRNKDTPIDRTTFRKAMRAMKIPADVASPHGFRSSFSTWANEQRNPDTNERRFDPDVIEKCLAHVYGKKDDDSKKGEQVRSRYNRATYWSDRVILMQAWGDYLDAIREADPLHFEGEGVEHVVVDAILMSATGP